jgi:hypothetical protein
MLFRLKYKYNPAFSVINSMQTLENYSTKKTIGLYGIIEKTYLWQNYISL